MGSIGTGRFLQSTISREWAWGYFKKNETPDDTPTSGSFGNDKTRQTASNREELERGWDGSLDEADER
jgi:hypothetical protein